jgi:hypothetical protein
MKQHPRRAHGQRIPTPQIPRQENHCIIEVFFLTIVLISDPQFGQFVLTEESPLTFGGPLIAPATHTQIQFIKTKYSLYAGGYFSEMQP